MDMKVVCKYICNMKIYKLNVMKKVLILSSSPRAHSNSDALSNEFMRGVADAGLHVEKIALRDKKVHPCIGCDICSSTDRPCPQKDDASYIVKAMIESDVIVMSTPVYFYSMSAQMKALIDRCCGLYGKMNDKVFYFIASAAEDDPHIMDRVVDSFRGFLDCLDNPVVAGTVFCGGVWHAGEIAGRPELQKAYEMGRSVAGR